MPSCPNTKRHPEENLERWLAADEAKTAKDDKDCCYFTWMSIREEDLPWFDEPAWQDYHLDGLKTASREWLEAVGILGDDVDEVVVKGKALSLRDRRRAGGEMFSTMI
ncbi:hypothetical protein LTR08_008862 [Meristemomyces frigidus]|nr:hypothetical protein LTR08_008862 [Meristemomyces frigidus]